MFRRGIALGCLAALIVAAGCAGPNFFPGVTFTCPTPATDESIQAVSAVAHEVGFVDHPLGELWRARFIRYHVVMTIPQSRITLLMGTRMSDSATVVTITDAGFPGLSFPPASAAIIRSFASRLAAEMPGQFTADEWWEVHPSKPSIGGSRGASPTRAPIGGNTSG